MWTELFEKLIELASRQLRLLGRVQYWGNGCCGVQYFLCILYWKCFNYTIYSRRQNCVKIQHNIAVDYYSDVIMWAIASQITGILIVYSTVCSGTDVAVLCEGNSLVTGEFPTQRASNAKNVSIWWCHHAEIYDGNGVQGLFCGCAQPMRDVTLARLIYKISSEYMTGFYIY